MAQGKSGEMFFKVIILALLLVMCLTIYSQQKQISSLIKSQELECE